MSGDVVLGSALVKVMVAQACLVWLSYAGRGC